jgi:hypothetical protein
MTATGERGESSNEAAFALLMLVLSVLVFLAVRRTERASSGSNG